MTKIEEIIEVLFSIGIALFATALLIGSIGIYLGEVDSFIVKSDWAKMVILLAGVAFAILMYSLSILMCERRISYYCRIIVDGLKRKVK